MLCVVAGETGTSPEQAPPPSLAQLSAVVPPQPQSEQSQVFSRLLQNPAYQDLGGASASAQQIAAAHKSIEEQKERRREMKREAKTTNTTLKLQLRSVSKAAGLRPEPVRAILALRVAFAFAFACAPLSRLWCGRSPSRWASRARR